VVVEEIEEEEGDQMSFGVIKDYVFPSTLMMIQKNSINYYKPSFLNLAGRGAFQPNPPPEIPFPSNLIIFFFWYPCSTSCLSVA
jgi:hypothetical protein